MGYTIALAGKGGTGKTTLAALLVRLLKEKKKGSILAVDADPNSNFAEALGLTTQQNVGRLLDDLAQHPEKIPAGTPKSRFIEYEVQTAIAEGNGFDVLTMGRPEGPGCYCYVNNVLREVMAKLIKDYDYVIIDNEAGLEHLSRRTTRSADILLVVSDATIAGLKAAKRIKEIVQELDIKTKKNLLLINRAQKNMDTAKISGVGLDYIGGLPFDEAISALSLNGNSLWELKDNSASLVALRKLGERLWPLN